jgi:hypothetical protein
MLRIGLSIVVALFGISIPAQAEVPLSGSARHKLAEYLFDQVSSIEKRLPSLSIDDRTRIEKKTKEALAVGDMMRFRTLMKDSDQTLWSVRQHLEPMLAALSRLANRQYDDKQAEVEMWGLVAKKLSEGAFYFGLEKLGLSRLVFPPTLVQGTPSQEKFHEIRLNIHNNILLAYIKGQLPD